VTVHVILIYIKIKIAIEIYKKFRLNLFQHKLFYVEKYFLAFDSYGK
jgi:hypothetical protein